MNLIAITIQELERSGTKGGMRHLKMKQKKMINDIVAGGAE